MKHLPLLVVALLAAAALSSCTGDLYRRAVPVTSTATSASLPPPDYGTPEYVSSLHAYGAPARTSTFYPYSESHPGGMGYYDRVASPRGSFQYIYHDLEAPHPAPGTPLKEKTVRYTSRYPSSWGSPVWVTTFKPLPARRSAPATSTVAVTQTTTTTFH